MTSYKPVDSKREEFRKYLEKGGVLEALTKVLVSLYEEPEKPVDALEYLKENLNLGLTNIERSELKVEVEELRKKVEALEAEKTELLIKLEKYENPSNTAEPKSNT